MSTFKFQSSKQPPKLQMGVIDWTMKNLFSSKLNIALSFGAFYLLYLIIPPLLDWLIFSADFTQKSNAECTKEAACWSFIRAKIDFFMYGLYPSEYYWRVNLLLLITLIFMLIAIVLKNHIYKNRGILLMLSIYPFIAFLLLYGSETFAIKIIQTHQWGGLMLTLVVASVGIVASFPIGVFLALGRQSKMKIIKVLSISYIEFIRGIPLITILFMASVMLPLFFTEGVNLDKLIRALIGITLFQSAYIAEIIRGGLQAIPKGQYEAADALGLSFTQKMALIILPQAIKASIPNLVGASIALFKDTTLVLIIGIFDMLAIAELATSDPQWLGRKTEGLVFVAIVTWIILYSMSRYSKKLELRFKR